MATGASLLLPNGQLSAAPLAGVCSVEDDGTRQLPGNARAADRWSAGNVGWSYPSEGCGWSCCQQAGAFCRVNRAQPTHRASGVSCTAWFGCARHEIFPINQNLVLLVCILFEESYKNQ